jgi:Family of unknown function (DUF6502)
VRARAEESARARTRAIGRRHGACAEWLVSTVSELLQDLAPRLIRAGITPRKIERIAAEACVLAASRASAFSSGRANISRIAVATGLTRPDVRNILSGTRSKGRVYEPRTIRVIRGWLSDVRFRGRYRLPAVLQLRGGKRSFAAVVKEYAGDVSTKAVLDELLRLNAVEVSDRGRVRLLAGTKIRGRLRFTVSPN